MDKLERLLNLTAALLEAERPLTAEELREKIPGYPEERESFRRQFERDKDDLREMGIPLLVLPVPGVLPTIDGYRVRKEDYYLRDPGLTADELAALHLASSAVHLDGIGGLGGLWKLGGAVATEAASEATEIGPLPADHNLVTLWGAVTDRRIVTFRYHDTERELHPYRLDFQRGRWYLSGFDRVRNEDRTYRLDRIQGDVVAAQEGGAFERPEEAVPGLSLEPWQIGDADPEWAELLVDSSQAPVAIHHLGREAVQAIRPDGSVVLRFQVTNRSGFRTFALGFLEHAEVLGPPELRDDLADWLRRTSESAGR